MTTPPEWAPELTIDLTAAASVVAEQFPALAGQPVTSFNSGWDNLVLAVGDDWLFRFIHRAVALDGARRELAVLTHLANRFAVPIPRPELVGRPTPDLPWPFWGARRLPGVELADVGLPDARRTAVASAVGAFLRELHAPDLAEETTASLAASGAALPVDPLHRADPALLVPRIRVRLATLVEAGAWAPDGRVEELLVAAGALGPPVHPPVLAHGRSRCTSVPPSCCTPSASR